MKRMLIVESGKSLRIMLGALMEHILPQGEWEIILIDPEEKGADIAVENQIAVTCAIITFSATDDGGEGVPFIRSVRKYYFGAVIIAIHQFESDLLKKATYAGATCIMYKGDTSLENWRIALRSLGLME